METEDTPHLQRQCGKVYYSYTEGFWAEQSMFPGCCKNGLREKE